MVFQLLFSTSRKIEVIYNGFDLERLKNDKSEELPSIIKHGNTINVGMVAEFKVHKDYETFFKAAEIYITT